MNKKIVIGIVAVAVVVIAATFGIKAIIGEKIALPGEEHTENALNLQETNQSQVKSPTGGSTGNVSGSSESTESGP